MWPREREGVWIETKFVLNIMVDICLVKLNITDRI